MTDESVCGGVRGTAVAPIDGSGVAIDPFGDRLGDLGERQEIEQECRPGPIGSPWASTCRRCGHPVHTDLCPARTDESLATLAAWTRWADAQSFAVPLVVDGTALAPMRDPKASQWHTRPKLADRLLSLVSVYPVRPRGALRSVPGVVLDLGAGGGALTDAALRAGAQHVVAVERDLAWVRFLRERYRRDSRVRVVEGDVDALASMGEREACARLGLDAPADVVVSNPAFEGGGFVRFGLAAIALAKVGAPCAFIGPIVALPTTRSLGLWTVAEISDLAICSRRPPFGGGATDKGGAQEDFVAVRFTGEPAIGETHHGVRVHFWPEAWS